MSKIGMRRFVADDVLVREGEMGRHFFLLSSGESKVYVREERMRRGMVAMLSS